MMSTFEEYEKSDKTVTDMTCNGTCSKCGQCCADLLPVSDREINIIKAYIEKHGIKPRPVPKITAKPVIDSMCPFLQDKNTDRCGIYPVRPAVCRAFTCSGLTDITENLKKFKLNSGTHIKRSMSVIFFPERK